MSPLTLDRIKKADSVRIHPINESDIVKYAVQVLESGVWNTLLTDYNRNICEQAVRKATSKVILG